MALQQAKIQNSAQTDEMIEEVDNGLGTHRVKPKGRKWKAQARVGEKKCGYQVRELSKKETS